MPVICLAWMVLVQTEGWSRAMDESGLAGLRELRWRRTDRQGGLAVPGDDGADVGERRWGEGPPVAGGRCGLLGVSSERFFRFSGCAAVRTSGTLRVT